MMLHTLTKLLKLGMSAGADAFRTGVTVPPILQTDRDKAESVRRRLQCHRERNPRCGADAPQM